jgi:hypothetical protein
VNNDLTPDEALLWLQETFAHTTAQMLEIELAPTEITEDLYDRFIANDLAVDAFIPVKVLVIDKSTEADRRVRMARLSVIINRGKDNGRRH